MISKGRGSGVVTLKDVAAAAGVSLATASQALAGVGRMTPATRAHVRRAADDLGYVANPVARGLRTGRTRALGVHHLDAAASLAQPYFREFLAGAIEAAHRRDHDLVVLSSDPQRPRTAAPHVDGVVIVDPIADDLRARELMEMSVPVVAGEHVPPGMPPCAVVAADHVTAVRAVLDAAATRGVCRPLLAAPDERSGWGNVLREAVTSWCAENGTAPVLVPTSFGEWSVAWHRELLTPVLAEHPEVDLVLGTGSAVVLGAAHALRAQGRQPGIDVLLASCADDPALLEESPAVTAVELPAHALGAACVERLLSLLDGEGTDAVLDTRTVPAPVHLRGPLAEGVAVAIGD